MIIIMIIIAMIDIVVYDIRKKGRKEKKEGKKKGLIDICVSCKSKLLDKNQNFSSQMFKT